MVFIGIQIEYFGVDQTIRALFLGRQAEVLEHGLSIFVSSVASMLYMLTTT